MRARHTDPATKALRRLAKQAFVDRALASAAKARKTNRYIPAASVIKKLERRLAKAKQRAGVPAAQG